MGLFRKTKRPVDAREAPAHQDREAERLRRAEQALDSLDLIVTVVNRSKSEMYTEFLRDYEANFQFSVMAEGTAGTELKEVLGLANTDKSAIFSVVRRDRSDEALDMLENKFRTVPDGKGVAVAIPFSGVIGVLSYCFLADKDMNTNKEF